MTVSLDQWLLQNRKKAGLSQKGLADLIGVSQQTIGKIESGKSLNSRHIYKIYKALKLDENAVDELPSKTRLDLYELRATEGVQEAIRTQDPDFLWLTEGILVSRTITPDRMPLFKMTHMGSNKVILDDAIRYSIARPEMLIGKDYGYAIVSIFFEMTPIYEVGDIIIVNPNAQPYEGEDCLFRQKASEALMPQANIGRITKITEEGWTAFQFANSQTIEFEDLSFEAHAIVGRYMVRVDRR